MLDQYRFAGLDASTIGALKFVADYYSRPITTSWLYGITGIAFLHILDEDLDKQNGGPPDPEVYKLARNVGLDIQGIHVFAEGGEFKRLQDSLLYLHHILVFNQTLQSYIQF